MRKHIFALICVATLILAMGSLSYAYGNLGNGFGHGYGHMYQADLSQDELEALHDERMESMKDAMATYLEDGKITQEQYDNWMQHIEEMDAYHEENGFVPGAGRGFGRGFGGCHNYLPTDTPEE